MEHTSCFMPAHILLPDASVPLAQWGCIACDQFTSDRAYWERAAAAAAGGPSALGLILPEVYLNDGDLPARVDAIHKTMETYDREVLTRAVDGYVYVERTLQSGRVRQGLVGRVDLEAYNYHRGSLSPIRPSENTVEERIPPRMAVRRGAKLETPHVMMLADDPDCTLIEPIGAQKDRLRPLYEGELMLGGGHVAGWAVEDPALVAQIEAAMAVLGSAETFQTRYPGAPNKRPLALAVGDGNHSLATAKAYWEELKPTLPPEQRATHPARWCLAEVCNVRSDAVEIEPIHRVLFNTSYETVLLNLVTWSDENMAGVRFGDAFDQKLQLTGVQDECTLSFETPPRPWVWGRWMNLWNTFWRTIPRRGWTMSTTKPRCGPSAPKRARWACCCLPSKRATSSAGWCWAACCPARPSAWGTPRKSGTISSAAASQSEVLPLSPIS